jgi:hypothetical protein
MMSGHNDMSQEEQERHFETINRRAEKGTQAQKYTKETKSKKSS